MLLCGPLFCRGLAGRRAVLRQECTVISKGNRFGHYPRVLWIAAAAVDRAKRPRLLLLLLLLRRLSLSLSLPLLFLSTTAGGTRQQYYGHPSHPPATRQDRGSFASLFWSIFIRGLILFLLLRFLRVTFPSPFCFRNHTHAQLRASLEEAASGCTRPYARLDVKAHALRRGAIARTQWSFGH